MSYNKIIICLDQSGSMDTMKKEVVSGLKKFFEEQQTTNPEVSLYTFDTTVTTVYENVSLSNKPMFEYKPNGYTALYDAIKTAIQKAEKIFNVVFVVITDGEDNSSSTTGTAAQEMLKKQETEYNWKTIYMAKSDIFNQQRQFFGSAAASTPFTNKNFECYMQSLGRQITTINSRATTDKGSDFNIKF